MGQKSNPIGLRLQINRTWDSRWYAEGRDYAGLLKEDIEMRKYIFKNLPQAAISKVVIERPAKLCRVSIYAARPGVIIGKKGADIEKLRAKLSTMTSSEVKLSLSSSAWTAAGIGTRKTVSSLVRIWYSVTSCLSLERRLSPRYRLMPHL